MGLGDCKTARASCETHRDYGNSLWCLAVIYEKPCRHADAQAQLSRMKPLLAIPPVTVRHIGRSRWNNWAQALKWLETALRLHDAGLEYSLRPDSSGILCARSRGSRQSSGS